MDGGTVHPGCILNGGTVPPGCILNGGTVPPFNLFHKLMNFFLNHALIYLSTAPTPQNILEYKRKEKHILILKCVLKVMKQLNFCSSIASADFEGGGVKDLR